MPIPFILGGIAVAAGLVGAKKALDASDKNARARRMNRRAQETFENAKKELLAARDEAGKALENLARRRWISFMAASPVSWAPSERFITWNLQIPSAWTSCRSLK